MRDFLVPLCPDLTDTIWLCDTDSYTSLENVWNFHTLMGPLLNDDATVAVYGDSSRALKLRLFASRALPWRTLCETCDMEANPIGQIISLGIESCMCYVPLLHVPWAVLRRMKAKRQ